jgi:hypothetical protein
MLVKGPISSKLVPKKIFCSKTKNSGKKIKILTPPKKAFFGGGEIIKRRFQRFCLSMICTFKVGKFEILQIIFVSPFLEVTELFVGLSQYNFLLSLLIKENVEAF